MKIAAYLRKSVKGDENSISIDAQLEIIKDYFRKEKNAEYTVYKDDGFSGGSTNRPSFQKMIEDASSGKYDVVACYKLDRMARNTLDFLTTFEMLKKIGTDLVCVQDNYDPRTPAGKMMMTLLASLAEMERENIRRRAIDGMFSLAKQGRWSGGTPPYGCSVVEIDGGKYLEIDKKDEITYIYNKFSKGCSMYSISKETGITTRNIQCILKNPIYVKSSKELNDYLESIGYYVIGEANGCGYMAYKHNKHKKDKLINLAVISKNKGIIDSSVWINCRERIKKNSVNPPRISNKTWLAHKIVCSECGRTLVIANGNKRKDGTRPIRFVCKHACVKGLNIPQLETKMFEALHKIKLKDLLKDENSTAEIDSYKKIKHQITSKEKIVNGLIDKSALASDNIAKTMLEKAEIISNEVEILKKDLLKYEIVNKNKDKKDELLKDKEKIKKEFIKNFNKLSMREKQEYISMIIDKCVWDGENLVVY